MMNDIQQSTLDYMVDQYDVGRPKPFKEANHFDLYTIHMMREIMNMEPSDETKEVEAMRLIKGFSRLPTFSLWKSLKNLFKRK